MTSTRVAKPTSFQNLNSQRHRRRDEIRAKRVIDSRKLLRGGEVRQSIARSCGAPYLAVYSTGSDGLWMEFLAPEFHPAYKVLTPPLRFLAAMRAIRRATRRVKFKCFDSWAKKRQRAIRRDVLSGVSVPGFPSERMLLQPRDGFAYSSHIHPDSPVSQWLAKAPAFSIYRSRINNS